MLGPALSRSLTMGAQGCGSDPGDAVGIRDGVDLEIRPLAAMKPITTKGRPPTTMIAPAAPLSRTGTTLAPASAPAQDRAPSNLRRASDDTSEPSWSIFSAASTGSQGFSKPPRREVSLMLNRLSGRA